MLRENLLGVQKKIKEACVKTHRSMDDVNILAVTKTKSIEVIEEAYNLGLRDFAENYVQELCEKKEKLSYLREIRWHLIGSLQTNKVKAVLNDTHCFHALDSEKLLKEIAKRNSNKKPWPVFVQVNIDQEKTKSGVLEVDLDQIIHKVMETPEVRLEGLMVIPSPEQSLEDLRLKFRKTKILAQRYGNLKLSMGMSNDYVIAIEEGANWIRLGRVLFGARS